jgi:hypothetical protein
MSGFTPRALLELLDPFEACRGAPIPMFMRSMPLSRRFCRCSLAVPRLLVQWSVLLVRWSALLNVRFIRWSVLLIRRSALLNLLSVRLIRWGVLLIRWSFIAWTYWNKACVIPSVLGLLLRRLWRWVRGSCEWLILLWLTVIWLLLWLTIIWLLERGLIVRGGRKIREHLAARRSDGIIA